MAPALACENGLVTLDGVLPHSAEHRARASYPLAFEPDAAAPKWERFLADLFRDDADAGDKIACLQEFLGGALFGLSTRFQKCIIATGAGSNGKSTLMEIVRALFPEDRVQSISPKRWEHPFTLAGFVGTLLNVVAELPPGAVLESDQFKAIITGDPITAEEKFKPAFMLRSRAGHLFACNALPATKDQSLGFWRRFMVLEFNRNFEGDTARDTNIATKILASERAGILSWLVRGASRLLDQDGYTIPASHGTALARWKMNSDSVRIFADEYVSQGEPARHPAALVYRTYRIWALESGYKPVAERTFKATMEKIDGVTWTRVETGKVYAFALVPGRALVRPFE